MLEQVEHAAQALHAGRQFGDADQVFFTRQHVGFAGLGERLPARFDRGLGELDDVLAQVLELGMDAPANLVEVNAGIVLVDEIGRFDQL